MESRRVNKKWLQIETSKEKENEKKMLILDFKFDKINLEIDLI
jgi:hypothetical protein